ncbi:hypothetical protein HBH56_048410 [Parastagonospora nodorum]|uniref:Transcription factor domain-containing protein n=2 Tax=Phaeosphaeria nodorum (strain SN15 / ATCC MYA-4574 / FGSC 10173) TaxID=321614 RepID=A0A7U2ESW5_PHANO|nr:hypothetical protein SNOG_08466 [Parastagonospora nodorum SN15]KAH3918055.1 hypothetical protein HBH56_048410 [Parastagonospora nodorum]EAT84742.1 hypothetical protein SNOG_08466 [Parastagonospora nodorum SN15]KAH3933073.1 hypothetical protein HBH54_076150 [Parastagonospora nodorum]KAH4124556.1 hypothetical protein HBH45_238890 [Parastagonospora nodorum]KAH4169138.1 hypothetical protein HBH44_049080 [Parastagonospora nodorum]
MPTQFMFIDSSNGGVNAKPDKIVRSFVMKSARNKKPWSTRPRSSKSEEPPGAKDQRNSLSRNYSIVEKGSCRSNVPRIQCNRYPAPNDSVATPPSSLTSDSVFSSQDAVCACDSPVSSLTSPQAECMGGDEALALIPPQHELPPNYNMLNLTSLGTLDCLVVPLDRHSEGLLHRFIEAAAPRLIPVDPHRFSQQAGKDWIQTCVQSNVGAPFIYAVLACSARAVQLDPEVYKWRAVSEVNGLLSDPRTSTNDTTIAAVLILLANEEAELADPKRRGDENKCKLTRAANEAHHNGLRTMIQQRGGLAALNGNRVLQVCLLMHSIAQSISTFKQPYAVLVNASGQVEDYAVTTSQLPSAFAHILRPFRELNIDRSLLRIIFASTVFIVDLTDWYSCGICPTDSLDLQKHASLLMYRLFDWHQQSECGSVGGPTPTSPVDQSVCLALLIFLVNATEPNAGPLGPRLSKVVTKLRQSLQRISMLRWAKCPDLLLWVLTMGALGAGSYSRANKTYGDPCLGFFTGNIKLALAGKFVHQRPSIDHLIDILGSCLWVPSVFNKRVRSLSMPIGLCGTCIIEVEDASSSEDELVDGEYALGHSTTSRFFAVDRLEG